MTPLPIEGCFTVRLVRAGQGWADVHLSFTEDGHVVMEIAKVRLTVDSAAHVVATLNPAPSIMAALRKALK